MGRTRAPRQRAGDAPHETVIHESTQRAHDVAAGLTAHLFHGIERHRTSEHAELSEQGLFARSKKLQAPVDRGRDGPLASWQVTSRPCR